MIKQIKDLSAATIDDLNDNCQFVMDDSNDKTKRVSFNVLKQKITSGTSSLSLSDVYPVGSIYTTITNSDTCPFEGVDGMHWEKIASGKCLFGADETHNVGSEIGAGLPLPTLSASGLNCQSAGNHSHKYYHATPQQGIGYGGSSGAVADETSQSGSHTHKITGTLSLSRDGIYGNSNTVQPPAIAVIFWKRVS